MKEEDVKLITIEYEKRTNEICFFSEIDIKNKKESIKLIIRVSKRNVIRMDIREYEDEKDFLDIEKETINKILKKCFNNRFGKIFSHKNISSEDEFKKELFKIFIEDVKDDIKFKTNIINRIYIEDSKLKINLEDLKLKKLLNQLEIEYMQIEHLSDLINDFYNFIRGEEERNLTFVYKIKDGKE